MLSRKRNTSSVDDDSPSYHPPAVPRANLKERVKRKRQVNACTECTRRKIRCDPDRGDAPCRACVKRGDETLCSSHAEASSSGAPNASGSGETSHEKCLQTQRELSFRLAHLESVISSQSRSLSSRSTPPSRSPESFDRLLYRDVPSRGNSGTPSGTSDTEDSETEDAALCLEDMVIGIRNSRVTSRAGESDMVPPALPMSLATSSPRDQILASLLVPPLLPRHQAVLSDVWAELPESKIATDWLVNHYFERVDWGWHLHHKATFLAEYETFSALVYQGRKEEIDPAWLAILFLTLCHAAGSLETSPQDPNFPITRDQLQVLPPRFFKAARVAMDCTDWTGVARHRTVQFIALTGPYLLFSGLPGGIERLLSYTAIGVRLCEQLGYHKLSFDPSRMPPDGAGLPQGTNTLRREMALRVFYGILTVDQILFRCRPVLPLVYVDSGPLGNYEDEDMSPVALSVEKPAHVVTAATFETIRFRTAVLQRQFHETVITVQNYEYDDVLRIDQGLRDLLARYPLDAEVPNESLSQFWSRTIAVQNTNIRLMRIHRPFMARGYRDGKYWTSTDGALTAARNVLLTQKDLHRTQAPLVKAGFQLLHVQAAIVVLFLDIWTNYRPGNSVFSSDQLLLSEVSACFTDALSSVRDTVRKVAQQSVRVLDFLFEALRTRDEQPDVPETYSTLLKRLGASLNQEFSNTISFDPPLGGGSQYQPLQDHSIPVPTYSFPSSSSSPQQHLPLLPNPSNSSSDLNEHFAHPPQHFGGEHHVRYEFDFGDGSNGFGLQWMELPVL